MHSNIPLPTDNIYKFYALFGIALIVSSILAITYISSNTFETGYSLLKDYEAINQSIDAQESLLPEFIGKQIKNLGENKQCNKRTDKNQYNNSNKFF